MESTLSEHVKRLHEAAFIVDAHFDLTYEVANRRDRGARKVIAADFLPDLSAAGVDLVVSAIFIHDFFLPEMGLRKALDQIAYLHCEMAETPGLFRLCRNMAEARAARADGELALFLSLEGADPLQNDINLLRIFHELGVRGLGLTWSRRNYAADGMAFRQCPSGTMGGLTAFGVELIAAAEELGMFIDVSHLSDIGVADVLSVARRPVIASHSNCRTLADTRRNLTDEQIKALAEKGGVIGMNAIDAFIRQKPTPSNQTAPPITIEDLVDHVDHIAALAGIDHAGIGFDFCDSLGNHLNIAPPIPHSDVLAGHRELPRFTEALIRRGYDDDSILAILGGNFVRVFEALL